MVAMCSTLATEGLAVDITEISWLLLKFMSDLRQDYAYCAQEFLILLSSNNQMDWLPAYLALQLTEIIGLTKVGTFFSTFDLWPDI